MIDPVATFVTARRLQVKGRGPSPGGPFSLFWGSRSDRLRNARPSPEGGVEKHLAFSQEICFASMNIPMAGPVEKFENRFSGGPSSASPHPARAPSRRGRVGGHLPLCRAVFLSGARRLPEAGQLEPDLHELLPIRAPCSILSPIIGSPP